MDWILEITNDKSLYSELQTFCNNYGIRELQNALKLYTDIHQKYICKTKTSISQISIMDIYYITIREHHISVHTKEAIYHKYGTLNKELKFLSPHGFVKCNQSCIVSLNKIDYISGNNLILTDGSKIPMSRNYTAKMLYELNKKSKKLS